MRPIIQVDDIAKYYRLGVRTNAHRTLREVIVEKAGSAFRRKPASDGSSDLWALNGVSFEVQAGEVVGIIGRNGAGKSTLLKILSRITKPTRGRIELRGRLGSLLEVGTGFHPELTGRENIFLNGAIMGMKRAELERKFDEIVEFSEIGRFLETPVKRYSSGMYMRLAFAVAAHLEPEILVVDEVLAVGDVAFQKKCLAKMEQVGRAGRTVLFVSHNMAAVRQLTSRTILLKNGQVKDSGPTAEVIDSYMKGAMDFVTTVYKVDEGARRYSHLNRAVEFIEVQLAGGKSLIPSDGDVELVIRVRGNATVDRFCFSLTILRIDGSPVGSCFGADECYVRQGQTRTYSLHLPQLRLAPGLYYMNVATGRGNHLTGHVNFDALFDVLHFEVNPPEGDAGTVGQWDSSWGPIRWLEPSVGVLE